MKLYQLKKKKKVFQVTQNKYIALCKEYTNLFFFFRFG